MAAEKLYYVNQYLRESTAKVLSCVETKKGWEVILDKTVFYPTGGGQPCDLGTIGEVQVLDVSDRNGEVLHLCGKALTVGEKYLCKIDWERRFMLMQQHSGEHLVSGIVHSRFGYDNVGFHMGSDVITIDFSGELAMEQLREVELAANEAVWQNFETTIFFPDAEKLAALPYRSKKELTGAVRLVQFGGIDLCACCGLHVQRTGEIGLIKLLSTTRFHSGSRVELLCGKRALEHLNVLCDQNREISALLSAKPVQTASAVQRMKAELENVQYRGMQLENRLFEQQAKEYEGKGDVLLFEEAVSPDALRRLTDTILQVCGGMCAVFSGEDGNYKYAIGTLTGDVRETAKVLNQALNGRGGGKPNFVQGSVAATRTEIEAFFKSRGER